MQRSINNSTDCVKSELDLFYVPPTNTSIESGGWGEYHPIANIENGPIEFIVPGSDLEYIHLNKTSLYLKVSIYKIDSTNGVVAVDNTDVFSPVNNFASSLFSQVDLAFNGTSFETSNSTYAYKAYIMDLLNYGEDAKDTYLQSSLFFKDDPKQFDGITIDDKDATYNSGFNRRRKLVVDGKGKIDMIT